jgi:hypothetical protein
MPGLVPGIDVFAVFAERTGIDGRDIREKTRFALFARP